MTSEPTPGASNGKRDRRREAALWFGVLAGPVLWFAHLMLSDGVSELACRRQPGWLTIGQVLLAVVPAGVVAIALVVSIVERGRLRDRPEADGERFLASAGVACSTVFLVLILFGGLLPHLFLTACGGAR
jgi:hypothetical protein